MRVCTFPEPSAEAKSTVDWNIRCTQILQREMKGMA
jgi:hypothetical protein